MLCQYQEKLYLNIISSNLGEMMVEMEEAKVYKISGCLTEFVKID